VASKQPRVGGRRRHGQCTPARTKILDTSTTPKDNRLLAALPEAAYRRLFPDLEATTLGVGETLFHPAGQLQYAYFPTSAIVTLSYGLEEGGVMATSTAPSLAMGREPM
jgi:hypothetical protein